MPLTGNRAAITSGGDADDGFDTRPEEPVCRLMTVPVSAHAAKKGSQKESYTLGKPSASGFSEKLTARTPRSALRRISAAATSASRNHGSWHGMNRCRSVAHHVSTTQSL